MAHWGGGCVASLGKKVRLATVRQLSLHRRGSMVANEFHGEKSGE